MQKYIRYQIENIEPVRIADESISQIGQVATLRYIPGSTIRGYIVNLLSMDADFSNIKTKLFSNSVHYLNAYLMIGEKELIPSPKGFYEDKKLTKGRKEIQNVVLNGVFSEGNKRATLGRYSYFENDTIYYYGVETNSDLKIKVNLEHENEKRNVFRNEYIMPGHTFVGYIAVDDQESDLAEKIKRLFSHDMYLGNARSSGFGRCKVIRCEETTQLPYREYAMEDDMPDSCYMMLLSHTVMRNENGEIGGLNLPVLQEKMGVKDLEISYCSTGTVNVSEYNRTLRGRTPSVCAYEMGSVFHFTYKGIFTGDKAETMMNNGLGIYKNEGFGRVLFLKNYEKIKYKEAGLRCVWIPSQGAQEKEDAQVIKQIAENYYRKLLRKAMIQYIVNNPLKKAGINNSQVGTIESLILANKYQPNEAKKVLKSYFEHAAEKEDKTRIQQNRASIQGFRKTVTDILDEPLVETLKKGLSEEVRKEFPNILFGYDVHKIFSEKPDEELKLKLEFLLLMIRFDNKEGE